MNNLSTPISYLPLQKFHIIPIINLDPASIKIAAKKAKCDREQIKYNTLLNAASKALGIKGGFAEYQQTYDSKLVPFLKKHGLTKRVDLLKQRKKGFDTFFEDITRQELSERLFFSGWSLPEQIFTGYNFNYKNTLDDGDDYFNRVLCTNHQTRVVEGDELKALLVDESSPSSFTFNERTGPHDLKNTSFYNADILKTIEHNINIANSNSNVVHDCAYDISPLRHFLDANQEDYVPDDKAKQAGLDRYERFASRTVLDLVVGSFMKDLPQSFNLLGDSLVKPVKQSHEIELYLGNTDEASLNRDKALAKTKFDLFRARIEQGCEGWVDIIPFNNKLVFLKGENGQYDFVFKNQRDKAFEHQIFGKSLKRSDIPSFISEYQFLRWHYFEYQGWRYLDSHNSENLFYEKGNKSSGYPGSSTILQSYHVAEGNFIPKPKKSSIKLSGFHEVLAENKPLMVSNLVTIDELNCFKEKNSDYLEYRVGDNLESVNDESDNALPATVTWFDVLAYINWFEKEVGVPVRLLNLSEYTVLREPEKIPTEREPVFTDLKFIDPLGRVYAGHPPYMAEDDFQKLTCRFGNTKQIQSETGLNFMESYSFAEWLLEETCIRSGNFKSFYNDDFIVRSKPPLKSTGKYKGVKVGFRLCYELLTH